MNKTATPRKEAITTACNRARTLVDALETLDFALDAKVDPSDAMALVARSAREIGWDISVMWDAVGREAEAS